MWTAEVQLVPDIICPSLERILCSNAVILHGHGLVEDMTKMINLLDVGKSFAIEHDWRWLLDPLVTTKNDAFGLL